MLFNRRRNQAVRHNFYALRSKRALVVLNQAIAIHQRRCTSIMEQREELENKKRFALREEEAAKRRNYHKMIELAQGHSHH
ncbi:hypothetical protein [Desulfobaculum bizertense]|uniref:Uncharacterized protein n=1 Tax=Desulfobaculum bizertense DSM 18034 TaxID=1121442 RepID=A0A1T4VW25_9BACT|nr:hypothetical protein [Desulfobaculum bizertense]UIJ36768.1 hypothetical protein LWC08_08445 [Desulfobaculum bizertense]SKA69214.1 hypothetical protein SAMN02745702_01068 [Desulfobaculum bizertense DSM 18034]